MQHGELPSTLHANLAYWILIGTNDIGAGCSGDAVVAGNIRVVSELQHHVKKHHQQLSRDSLRRGFRTTPPTIVLNSLFPRTNRELLHNSPHWKMMQDVNQRLECYAAITPGVVFVNTTDIFVITKEAEEADNNNPQAEDSNSNNQKKTTTTGGVFVNPEMFVQDNLHPSAEGSKRWEEFIVDTVLSFTN